MLVSLMEAETDDVVCQKRPGKGKERGRAGVPGSSCLCLLAATDDAASRRPVGLCSAADLHRCIMHSTNSVHKMSSTTAGCSCSQLCSLLYGEVEEAVQSKIIHSRGQSKPSTSRKARGCTLCRFSRWPNRRREPTCPTATSTHACPFSIKPPHISAVNHLWIHISRQRLTLSNTWNTRSL